MDGPSQADILPKHEVGWRYAFVCTHSPQPWSPTGELAKEAAAELLLKAQEQGGEDYAQQSAGDGTTKRSIHLYQEAPLVRICICRHCVL